MPKVYGIGAAVVILGAMFKLLNWPGGAFMLGLGLSTEALIFILGAFEPKEKEWDWAKVYPQFRTGHDITSLDHTPSLPEVSMVPAVSVGPQGINEKLDVLLDVINQGSFGDALDKLTHTMQGLTSTMRTFSTLPDVANQITEYADKIKKASTTIEMMGSAQETLVEANQSFLAASHKMQTCQDKLTMVAEGFERLGGLWQEESTSMSEFLTTARNGCHKLSASLDRVQSVEEEAEAFKLGLIELNSKVSSLSSVYNSMLTAMKS